MPKCYHCPNPAALIQQQSNMPFCLDCWDKFTRILDRQNAQLAQEMNFVVDMMEATVGLPGILPRYQIPQPTIHRGPMTLNNIKVDRSVVGAINTGEIKKLDVSLSNIKNAGDEALSTALQAFAEAVINEQKINKEEKDKLIELITFLAEQGSLPKEQRKKRLIKITLDDIANACTVVSAAVPYLPALWQQVSQVAQKLLS